MTAREVASVTVRCCNRYHKIAVTETGKLVFFGHKSARDLKEDMLLRSFGGKECRCAQILDSWQKRHIYGIPQGLRTAFRKRNNKWLRHWTKFSQRLHLKDKPAVTVALAPTTDKNAASALVQQTFVGALRAHGWSVKTYSGDSIQSVNGVPFRAYFRSVCDAKGELSYVEISVNCYRDNTERHYVYIKTDGSDCDITEMIKSVEQSIFKALMELANSLDINGMLAGIEAKALHAERRDGMYAVRCADSPSLNLYLNLRLANADATVAVMKYFGKAIDLMRRQGRIV